MSRKTRKLIWSAPLVAVLAVAGALAMFVALSPNEAQADHITLPGAPTNVEAEAVNAESIKVKWDAPADDGGSAIVGYRIDYLDGGSGITWRELVADTGNTGTEHTDEHELGSNEDRAYRVFAINALGTGPTSAVAFGNTNSTPAIEAPGAVTNLSVRAATGSNAPTQLDLTWSAPAKDGGSPITSYRIHMARTDSDVPDETVEVSPSPSFTAASPNRIVIDTESTMTSYSLTGLRAQHTWHISVRPVNKSGAAGADAVSTADALVRSGTTGQAINPARPTSLRAVATADDAVALYWYWPEHDGGADIANFRVEVKRSGGWPVTADDDAAKPIADLPSNGNAVIVAALNTTATADSTHTSIPGDLDDDGETDENPTQRTLTYRVFAVTGAAGTEKRSAPSNEYTVTLDSSRLLSIPAGATADPASPAVPGRLELEWDAATHVVDDSPADANSPGYRIDYSVGSNGNLEWQRLEPNTIFTDLPYKHDAMPSQAYRYRVFAQPLTRGGASGVFGGTTSAASAAAAAGAPTDLRGTVVNPGQIDLEWTAPEEDGGSEITGYRIVMATGTGTLPLGGSTATVTPIDFTAANATVTIDTKGDGTSYSLMGLSSLTTWQIAVYTLNASGAQGATVNSATSAGPITVTTTEFDAPAPPIGLLSEAARNSNLTSRNQRGVLLLWNAPEPPAGAQITGYEIQWKEYKEGEEYASLVIPSGTDLRTHQTHAVDPKEGEVRVYQVRSLANSTFDEAPPANVVKSDWVTVRYPADTSHMEPLPLVAPDSVTAVIDETDPRLDDVIVTWTGGSGPEGTKVAIGVFTRDFSTFLTDRTVNDAMGGTHKFDDLPDGEYVIVVATYHPDDLTVGAGKRSNVIAVPGS